jgi:hypothetical protein
MGAPVPLKISMALLKPEPSTYSEKNTSVGMAAPAGGARLTAAGAARAATSVATTKRRRRIGRSSSGRVLPGPYGPGMSGR